MNSGIISKILYWVGFIIFVVFLTFAKNVGTESFLYALGASLGVLMFCESKYFKK